MRSGRVRVDRSDGIARRRPLDRAYTGDEQPGERDDGAGDAGQISVVARRARRSPGPVSANESGSRPIEISQSRLDTRPSILRRT